MILSTTPEIQGKKIVKYYGVVTGEVVLGTNIFRDIFASIRDIVGGRSAAYEKELKKGRQQALEEMSALARSMGANAVVGIDIDFETVGEHGTMLMISATGTAVSIDLDAQ